MNPYQSPGLQPVVPTGRPATERMTIGTMALRKLTQYRVGTGNAPRLELLGDGRARVLDVGDRDYLTVGAVSRVEDRDLVDAILN